MRNNSPEHRSGDSEITTLYYAVEAHGHCIETTISNPVTYSLVYPNTEEENTPIIILKNVSLPEIAWYIREYGWIE